MGTPRGSAIPVRITPENLAELRSRAGAKGQSLTWYILTRLGLDPKLSDGGRVEHAIKTTPGIAPPRRSNRLPVQLTAEEKERFQQLVAASGKSQSAYVHMRLGIEPRERGRPGHRR
ncbi:MAG: hypothetical protein JWM57_3002 [Phycisphaerales bacterium]|nr:hypothetical protein [Phycisphaerales bacterium]